jgi:hypothetical protein
LDIDPHSLFKLLVKIKGEMKYSVR